MALCRHSSRFIVLAALVAGCSSGSSSPAQSPAPDGGSSSRSGGGPMGDGGSGGDSASSGNDGSAPEGGHPTCDEKGFQAAATSFALPMLDKSLPLLSGDNTSCSPFQEWSTLDLTGDGRPDLVLTQSCSDATAGTTHWQLYAGNGSGFSATPASFTLPALDKPLPLLSGNDTGCSPFQEWSTVDLTGDGKPDLVVTQSCSDATVGRTHWQLYTNTGSGFSSTPTSFALPTLDKPLPLLSGNDTSCSSFQEWSTVDLTGDAKPDLVVTQSCSDATAGTTHWQLYTNTGSGFSSTPTSFALPTLDKPLPLLSGNDTGCSPFQEWSTLDLTGDGKPDLVLTQSCSDATAGKTHWQLYTNTGSGFSSTPASFALPTLDKPLPLLSGNDTGCSPFQEWSTVDLTRDGKPDLVVTQSCSDATAGTTHWQLYANTGSGFSATSATFALPTLDKPLPLLSGNDTGCSPFQEWSTLDMTGDGKVDLVLTQSCSDATDGMTHWSFYAGVCGL